MNSRLAKQIIYGAGYLAVLFLLFFAVYFFRFKPAPTCFDAKKNQGETGVDCGGPCLPCEIKTLVPPEISWLKNLPADNQTIIAAEIKNPNLDWGADFFSYSVDIYGNNGEKIKTVKRNSFIYAGEIKYLIEPVEIDSKSIGKVEISFADFNWKSNEEFKKPTIQTREIKTEDSAIGGFLTNNNAFKLSKIKVFGFLYNQYGILSAASKTELENINAFEEKFFKINFPKNISSLNIDFNKTKIYVEAIR
jgi:hypothetical protein